MTSAYITNWINDTQSKIDFWLKNYPLTTGTFFVSLLPGPPHINTNILNHNLTSCCPNPPFPAISFAHFPEPYYGDPDDNKTKQTVVLFYNPGPSDPCQHITAAGPGTFNNNYLLNNASYYNLSSSLSFCSNTINNFWTPKNKQLNSLFNLIPGLSNNFSPLFMDMIPWHSDKFKGVNSKRLGLSSTLSEFKGNVIIPAVLNANNTFINTYINQISKVKNKIVLFAIGALYTNGNYLKIIGFDNVTNIIPPHSSHKIIHNKIVIGNSSKVVIWKINSNDLIKGFDNLNQIENKEIFIINMWTTNVGMNIPVIPKTIDHIFKNL